MSTETGSSTWQHRRTDVYWPCPLFDILDRYGITVFDDAMELEREAQRG